MPWNGNSPFARGQPDEEGPTICANGTLGFLALGAVFEVRLIAISPRVSSSPSLVAFFSRVFSSSKLYTSFFSFSIPFLLRSHTGVGRVGCSI